MGYRPDSNLGRFLYRQFRLSGIVVSNEFGMYCFYQSFHAPNCPNHQPDTRFLTLFFLVSMDNPAGHWPELADSGTTKSKFYFQSNRILTFVDPLAESKTSQFRYNRGNPGSQLSIPESGFGHFHSKRHAVVQCQKWKIKGKQMKTAVYTGSFDPISLGHLNVIQRSCRLVDHLVIGIGFNSEKSGLFEPEERLELVRRVTAHLDNVEVKSFEGLAVDFVKQCNSKIMIRGVRPLTDIAAEFTMMMANRQLNDDLETVFLMADGQYAHVSSSLIKQITPLANDEQLAKFVPKEIIADLRRKIPAS